jgi:hypothetical protein
MMARAFHGLNPCISLGIGPYACVYVLEVTVSGVVGALTSLAQPFPRKESVASRV